MNRLSLSLSFLLFPFASAASEAEFNANYAAWKSINLSAAYDAGLSGKGVTVAVIDNGFLDTHQEFEGDGKFIRIGSYTQNHGTSVASIIGAAQNDLGMQGVAYNAIIAAAAASDIKNDDGTPSQCANCYAIDEIFEALKDDKYKDVKIINASWGGKDVTAALGGIPNKLLVAAAGNEMALNPAYPALTPKNDSSLKNVISVVAFNPNVSKDNPYFLASFTNLAGEAANWTVSAPGVRFYAATGTADDAYNDNFNGTSAAAPVVSGAASLVQEKFSFLTGKQIGDVLLTTANNDFSGFAPYALQEIVDEKNEENSKYRLVYFTNNKAGENDSAMSKEDVLQRVGITCDENGENCKMGTTKYEVVSMKYSAAYGAGILDVGKALNGLGALDGSRLADGETMYTLEIPNDVEAEFSNNIIQRNTADDVKLGFSKSGGGTLILSGSNTYKGDTVVTAGTLKLTGSLAAGAAAQSAGTLVIEGATIEGAVSNDASVEFNGGTIKGDFTNNSSVKMADGTLSGALKSAAGNFEMTGGTLTGNVENGGTFTMKGGAFTPAETAAFANKGFFDYYSGSIGSNIVNEGTFNNYGMFENVAVSGGALHNKEGATVGSSFSVKKFINEGNIALLTDENGDLLKMKVAETAKLNKGRFVAAKSAAAAYNNGATYRVLEAGTSLIVEAGFEKDVRLIGLIDGTMTQDGNNLDMKITYLDMSDPANMPELDAKELSVAKAIDRMFKTEGNKEFGGYYYQAGTDLKKQINSLRDQIQAVKTQDLPLTNVVSNNVYSHLFRVRQQRAVNPALQNRTPQFRYRGGYYRGRSGGDDIATAKIWAQALGGYAKFGASDETNRGTAKTDMAGGQFGWDYQVSDTFLFGLTAGFASSNTKQDEDKMRVLDYRAGFYTGSRFGRVSLDTVVLGGVQRYEGRRFTDITGLTAISKSSYKGYSVEGGVNLSLETGRTPRRDHTFGIRPYVSANVSYTHQDAYEEKGDAEAINMSVSDANDTSVSVQPGMQFSYMWADAVLTLDAGWQRLLTGGNPTTKAYFINDAARTSFESLVNDADKNYVSLAIGLESNLSRRTRLKLWADQKRSKNNVISTLSAALQYAF